MSDKIRLTKRPADMTVGKSYRHCQQDVSIPASVGGWHPQFSERFGIFRFVSIPGSHEVCFTNPLLLAHTIILAGRD
jgi:hypothetical protein